MALSPRFFIETPVKGALPEPTGITFYERVFELKFLEVFIRFGDKMIRTDVSLPVWVDSGVERIINPENPPLLTQARNEYQLMTDNSVEIRNLYDEAFMLDRLERVSADTVKIVIVELRKLLNLSNEDMNRTPNVWRVYRATPSLEDVINHTFANWRR